jgi:hypothetical protein
VNGTPFGACGFHVYVSAPAPLRVVVLPKQTDALLTEPVTIGNEFTVTKTPAELVLVHPVKVFVPFTE